MKAAARIPAIAIVIAVMATAAIAAVVLAIGHGQFDEKGFDCDGYWYPWDFVRQAASDWRERDSGIDDGVSVSFYFRAGTIYPYDPEDRTIFHGGFRHKVQNDRESFAVGCYRAWEGNADFYNNGTVNLSSNLNPTPTPTRFAYRQIPTPDIAATIIAELTRAAPTRPTTLVPTWTPAPTWTPHPTPTGFAYRQPPTPDIVATIIAERTRTAPTRPTTLVPTWTPAPTWTPPPTATPDIAATISAVRTRTAPTPTLTPTPAATPAAIPSLPFQSAYPIAPGAQTPQTLAEWQVVITTLVFIWQLLAEYGLLTP